MQDLETLRTLQVAYQTKFSILLKLQEELNISGNESADSLEYINAKEDWLKAGADLKTYLEQQD